MKSKQIKTQKSINNKTDESISRVENIWQQLLAIELSRNPDRFDGEFPSFIDYAWRNFDPKIVIEQLLANKTPYRALKPILFSGLCTWVVCPEKASLRQHGMMLAGIKHLEKAESEGRSVFAKRDFAGRDLIGDIYGRLTALGQNFYSDFYYPVGGLRQVLRCTSEITFQKSIIKHSKTINNIIAIMEIYDYHAKYLGDKKIYYAASEGKAYELVRAIRGASRKEIGVSIELSKDRWQSLNGVAALAYAAATIQRDKNNTLLDLICCGEASYEEDGHLLPAWIARARYLADDVLSRITKPEVGEANGMYLPDIKAEATPKPNFSPPESALINAEFDIAAILKGRSATHQKAMKKMT